MRLAPRVLWTLLAAGTALIAGASIALTAWFDLHPCHLCVFQRLLFMLLAMFALAAAIGRPPMLAVGIGIVFVLTALCGAGVAAYQSWLQWQPAGSVSCAGGPPGPIEGFVERLGQVQPELFLATGFCEDVELMTLGLSLANLAFLAYLGCFILGTQAMRQTTSIKREIFL